ncbi:YncE family protein [Stakelama sp. CBK3Z-3]|uniref:YncE family protein n=1 Tax=Stakelama flava TaxID=2860338 RepID=A0ABS6XK32_9SPHN|nr:YncE family protein [Stakelama flava]MBW4330566.1 YncE family protein [Stakelama flava]
MAFTSAHAADHADKVLDVPGFADFLAVDGTTVWVTNRGRVEHWSRDGKLGAVAMAHPCGAMTIAAGSLWVADCENRTLNRIDLKTTKLTNSIPTGIANPAGELIVAAGAGSIWIASNEKGEIARVDPASNSVTDKIAVDPGTYYLAFGFGSLWAVSATQNSVQQIDPETNSVVSTAPLGRQPGFLAAGAGGVWVQEQGDGTVARIDPDTGQVAGRIKVDETLKYGDIDTGGGKVWLRTTAGQTFAVIDPETMEVSARIGPEAGSGALRYTPSGIWTSEHDRHTLSWWSTPATPSD